MSSSATQESARNSSSFKASNRLGERNINYRQLSGKARTHRQIEFPPKLSVSQMVNALKGVSSRRYGQAGYLKPYGKDALWSPSYFVSSVGGAPIEVIERYIREQEKPS